MAANSQRRIGLARALSKLGYCSRSDAAELVRTGRVSLNGKIRRDAEFPAREKRDRIAVDGEVVGYRQRLYLMMNKPRGVVTTASDETGRKTVYHVLVALREGDGKKSSMGWVAPVGRLDKASEGLLLFTNDSEWGARIAAPETHLEKTYHVQIAAIADSDLLGRLTDGVVTKDHQRLRALRAHLLRSGDKNCWIEIVLDEGRNRHIRKMLEALGVGVLRLVRVAIGPLLLGDLGKGQHRELMLGEKTALDRAMRKTK